MSKNMCVSHHLVFLLLFDSSFSTVAQTNKVPLSAHTACSGLHTPLLLWVLLSHDTFCYTSRNRRRGYYRKSELLQPLQYRKGHSCLSAREHHLTSRDAWILAN